MRHKSKNGELTNLPCTIRCIYSPVTTCTRELCEHKFLCGPRWGGKWVYHTILSSRP